MISAGLSISSQAGRLQKPPGSRSLLRGPSDSSSPSSVVGSCCRTLSASQRCTCRVEAAGDPRSDTRLLRPLRRLRSSAGSWIIPLPTPPRLEIHATGCDDTFPSETVVLKRRNNGFRLFALVRPFIRGREIPFEPRKHARKYQYLLKVKPWTFCSLLPKHTIISLYFFLLLLANICT